MNNSYPTVSIIIVNYNGSHLLSKCLPSLRLLKYPKKKYEVIVVDNGSTDGSSGFLRQKFPWVKLISCSKNLGFTGGNNVGLKHATGELIALLNNDTTVTRNWLIELVKASKPKNVGIVTSKMFFSIPYLKLRINSTVVQQSDLDGSADFAPRGILVEDVIITKNQAHNNLVWYESNFKDPETINGVKMRWTTGDATVYLPMIDLNKNSFTFIFHGYPTSEEITADLELKVGKKSVLKTKVGAGRVKECEVSLNQKLYKKHLKWLVQNAGNIVLRSGYSKDRGNVLKFSKKNAIEFYEEDSEYFSKKEHVIGSCGAGMLIKREVINAIGTFDGHYFMYYEDVDFSLRAWRMGWDIVYAPEAVLYHDHRGSTGKDESPFTINLTERNHLFLLVTHFPVLTCMIEYLLFLIRLSGSFFMQFVFQFARWSLYKIWKAKATARLDALTTFHSLLPNLLKNRAFWKAREKRSFIELEKYLY